MHARSDKSESELTDEMLASYAEDSSIHRIGEVFLPSRGKIVEILDQIRRLLFPGFFGHKMLSNENIVEHVDNLLAKVYADMVCEVNHCICTNRSRSCCPDPDACLCEAREQVRCFMDKLPEIRRMLSLDAQAGYDGDPAAMSVAEVVYCYPGYYAVTAYRIAHELWIQGVELMARIMSEYAHSLTGADIHPGARIGKSFFIDHATGVVIGQTARIGDNVKIYQGVTLGALSFPKDERGRLIKGIRRHPKLEDNVTIYANATVLGGQTTIGHGVTVAGNTFVTESITAESVVAHEKPRLEVRKRGAGPRKRDGK